MEKQVIRIIAETCDVNPDDVRPDRLLVDYGLDSARAIDLLVSLEEAFRIQISDEAAATMRKVEDVINYVRARVES